ncbi:phosphoribosylglycinamide formyltransferase [Rheinheimera baltica]|uniref:phosphoribosylglycinamide formyltransferase n=1 Tax=Rheinheimera baltica TaxID=67576 RepID=UPI000403A07F|nr:formyltransferase family protein [Rheinheimera baltica]MDP5190179.1 formyltransferase family protein [Rheinheimera baltica]
MTKIALLCSTGAAVAKYSFKQDATAAVDMVITDRDCGAAALADMLNVPLIQLTYTDRAAFSAALLQLLQEHCIDYLVSFYTRLLAEPLLSAYQGRLLNFHPSLLPACPGQHGFEDTMRSGALFFGSTVHLIDAGVDTGKPVIQVVAAKDPRQSVQQHRHQVFAQQCASYSQLIRWLRQSRLQVDEHGVSISSATYEGSPNKGLLSVPTLDDTATAVYQSILCQSNNL